ncbi:hypothetical protein BU23DRAFT_563929 [Bimuria novae-zelandiae CBS 107.79]|uniref:Uncharacterized protein n=1 Tax=Bimuria novae-zelandiae CBS 107.79 TaxID=1447943 RepID=A0A6A5VNK7_9PLEO|nr:hypothetical protein BU23DRAFT_563929 [Bimuria novae-zelandiae CBS 107.79]
MACKAGALCIVVRNANWRPKIGQVDIPARLSTVVAKRGRKAQQVNSESLGLGEATRFVANFTEGEANVDSLEELVGETTQHKIGTLKPKATVLKVYQPTWLKENQSRWWAFFDTLLSRNIVDTTLQAVHGSYKLPDGYSFAILPRNTIVHAGLDSSCVKILASIAQLLIATYTLWLHQGDQVDRWGFASFTFVPVPYAIMSLTNGLSHLFTSDYPALCMISSPVMQEVIDAGGDFSGIVGHVLPVHGSSDDTGYGSGFGSNWKGITPGVLRRTMLRFYNSAKGLAREEHDIMVSTEQLAAYADFGQPAPGPSDDDTPLAPASDPSKLPRRDDAGDFTSDEIDLSANIASRREAGVQGSGLFTRAIFSTLFSGLTFLVIGLMSGFSAGSNSKSEQVVLMMWLAAGIVVGFLVPFLNIDDAITILVKVPVEANLLYTPGDSYTWSGLMVVLSLPWSVFVLPIWGFVIIGKQLDQ